MKFDSISYIVRKIAHHVIRDLPSVRLFEDDGRAVFRRAATDSVYITLIYEPLGKPRSFICVSFDYYMFAAADRSVVVRLVEDEVYWAVEQLLNGVTVKEPAENEFGVVSP